MSRRNDVLRQKTWRAFQAASVLLAERIDRDMAAAGVLPLDSYGVLLALHEAPRHELRLNLLAEAVLLSRSGVTRLVDRLEKAGLLFRKTCPKDRRGLYAALTEQGRAELEKAGGVYRKAVAEHFGGRLSDDEAQTLSEVCCRLASAARGIGEATEDEST